MFFGRGKNFIKTDLTSLDVYKDYKSKVDKGSIYDVSQHDYMQICGTFNDMILKRCVDDMRQPSLVCGLGKLIIMSNNMNYSGKPMMDWKQTVERGKRIFILNEHTDGKVFKLLWLKPRIMKGVSLYNFRVQRCMKRKIADNIKNKMYKYG